MHTLIKWPALIALISPMVATAETPAVAIKSASYVGSGCPESSATPVVSPDGQAITIIFDQFFAVMEDDSRPQLRHQKCDIELAIEFPAGWQFSLTSVDYRGFANLEAGTYGQQFSQYKFRGGQFMKPSHARIEGEYVGDYFKHDESGSTERGWSSCEGPINLAIGTFIKVGGPARKRAYLSIDSIDGEVRDVTQTYNLRWRRC